MRSAWISTATACSTTRWPTSTATASPSFSSATTAPGAAYFSDDGTGTWAVSVDRAGQLRWFGLDGVEHTGGPLVDVDADGTEDRVLDADGDGLADRALAGGQAYVDTDADGRWDIRLTDSDGDGRADAATDI